MIACKKGAAIWLSRFIKIVEEEATICLAYDNVLDASANNLLKDLANLGARQSSPHKNTFQNTQDYNGTGYAANISGNSGNSF